MNFPELISPFTENPKYMVISSLDTGKPTTHYSRIAVHKFLKVIRKAVKSIFTLRNGNLCLLVKNVDVVTTK